MCVYSLFQCQLGQLFLFFLETETLQGKYTETGGTAVSLKKTSGVETAACPAYSF